MSFWVIVALFMIMSIHFKTEDVKYTAVTWGILFALFVARGGWLGALAGGVTAGVVAFSVFTLANYLEESIFLRLFILLLGMLGMLVIPSFIFQILS